MHKNKVDNINYLFRSFNKDPFAHSDQVKHFLMECDEFDADVVDQAVKDAIVEEKFLPKAWTIVSKCKDRLKLKEYVSEYCNICNGIGLVYSVFCIDKANNTRTEIVSSNHEIRKDCVYASNIIGACMCLNGERYAATRKRVEPWAFIVDGAFKNNWDCVFEADYVAKSYNEIIKNGDNLSSAGQQE